MQVADREHSEWPTLACYPRLASVPPSQASATRTLMNYGGLPRQAKVGDGKGVAWLGSALSTAIQPLRSLPIQFWNGLKKLEPWQGRKTGPYHEVTWLRIGGDAMTGLHDDGQMQGDLPTLPG